jgi:uncharacterized membrane protein
VAHNGPMELEFLKLVHVLAVMMAVGANVTYGFWIALAGRDSARLSFAIAGIRRLDRALSLPAYLVVLATGVVMILGGLYSFETGWIVLGIFLFAAVALIGFAGFAPAIRRQMVEAERDPTSDAYDAAARRSALLGYATTAIVALIVGLMVVKPAF